MEQIQNQLKNFPDGKLNYSCVGDRVKWYCRINKQKHYIPVADIDFAKKLAMKRYLSLQQNNLSKNLQACDSFLKYYEHSQIDSFLSDSPIAKYLLPEYFLGTDDSDIEWANADYEKCNLYPENLKHKTVAGIFVRSKSEAMIVRCLYKHRISFRYECKLGLGEYILYPDFTILHPETGKIIYWEHFGMMDNKEYRKNAFEKLDKYSSFGILPSVQLITTYEDSHHPFNYEDAEKTMQHFLLS